MALSPGEIIDEKYRVLKLLGEGGMGAVYEGENTRIHRRVAIKVLHAHVANNQAAVNRFEREAQAAGRIGSEHIVEVLDLGVLSHGDRYLVMEYLDGETLSARLTARGRMTPHELLPILLQALEGLAAAHQAGIIHRDLKPDNIFLVKNKKQPDFVKLVDFGISKFSSLDAEFSMTRTGAVMGTPYYMSPEQAQGKKSIDHRVDIYALGVILYEAAAGRVPFQADTFNELMFNIALKEPAPLAELAPGMDPGFAGIVAKAMAREPDQRFATAQDFALALHHWAQTSGLRASSYGAALPDPAALFHPSAGTGGAWATTGDGARAKKRNRGAVVALAVVGSMGVVLAAGGVVAFQLKQTSDQAVSAATKAEEERQQAEADAKEKERARAEATAEAERARLERERLAAEAEAKAKQAAAEREAAVAEEEAQKSAAPARPAARAPVTSRAPQPTKTEPRSGSKSGDGTVSGRKIRTEL